MINNKITPLLQLALRYENLMIEDLKESFIIDPVRNIWQIVVEYLGTLEELQQGYNLEAVYDLKGGFAQVNIAKDLIGDFSNAPNVIRLSLPRRLNYCDIGLGQVCGGNITNPNSNVQATGEGVLLAVIDSGIRYNHPDFITEEGNSRIVYLWDQSIGDDTTAENGGGGTVYTREQINEALSYSTREEQLRVVPSLDVLGHGTTLAGIAAGNGRASTGRVNRGVAPDCEFIIVKALRKDGSYPRDVDIMQGIRFAIEKAIELRKPLIVVLGICENLTGHDGSAPLEIYISRQYNNWLINFVVGTGNEGNRSSHASGKITNGQTQTIQISVEGTPRKEYGFCIWKRFSDEISLVLQAPTGEQTDVLSLLTSNRAYLFGEVAVLINYSEPITSLNNQVIYVIFQAQGDANINSGLWTVTLMGAKIIEGNYEVWGAIIAQEGERFIRFLNPDLNSTMTSPATGTALTSVGAYNGNTLQIAAFSGRGYTADGRVAPSLVAPGVNIMAPCIGQSYYRTVSGTSAAAAFVAGAYVVLMGYGVYTLNNPNYYGEVLKMYLLRNAKRPPSYAPYPNNSWGYGLLCIEAALLNMQEVANQTS